jgi:hypothetical protein
MLAIGSAGTGLPALAVSPTVRVRDENAVPIGIPAQLQRDANAMPFDGKRLIHGGSRCSSTHDGRRMSSALAVRACALDDCRSSHSVDHHLRVIAGHDHRAIAGAIAALDEHDQFLRECGLPLRIERREGPGHRAVVSTEYVDPVGR